MTDRNSLGKIIIIKNKYINNLGWLKTMVDSLQNWFEFGLQVNSIEMQGRWRDQILRGSIFFFYMSIGILRIPMPSNHGNLNPSFCPATDAFSSRMTAT